MTLLKLPSGAFINADQVSDLQKTGSLLHVFYRTSKPGLAASLWAITSRGSSVHQREQR